MSQGQGGGVGHSSVPITLPCLSEEVSAQDTMRAWLLGALPPAGSSISLPQAAPPPALCQKSIKPRLLPSHAPRGQGHQAKGQTTPSRPASQQASHPTMQDQNCPSVQGRRLLT